MALRADRHEALTDLSFYMNVTGERGQVVVYSTVGSGAAMDDANAIVERVSTTVGRSSGTRPAGVLLNDVVNLDLLRTHVNQHKDEVQIGGKVLLLKRGWIVTDQVSGTPTAGAEAFYNGLGQFTTNRDADATQDSNRVGQFLSTADADGYVKVSINID